MSNERLEVLNMFLKYARNIRKMTERPSLSVVAAEFEQEFAAEAARLEKDIEAEKERMASKESAKMQEFRQLAALDEEDGDLAGQLAIESKVRRAQAAK